MITPTAYDDSALAHMFWLRDANYPPLPHQHDDLDTWFDGWLRSCAPANGLDAQDLLDAVLCRLYPLPLVQISAAEIVGGVARRLSLELEPLRA